MTREFFLGMLMATGMCVLAHAAPDQEERPSYGEVVASIRDTFGKNQQAMDALHILEEEVDRVAEEIPADLALEMRNAIALDLRNTLRAARMRDVDFRASLAGMSCVSLTQHVVALPYRKIPAADEREKAAIRYTAIIDRLETKSEDDPRLESLRRPLVEVRDSVFSPGYGRLLSDQEVDDLNALLDDLIAKVKAAPRERPKGRLDFTTFVGLPLHKFITGIEPNWHDDAEYRIRSKALDAKTRPIAHHFMRKQNEQLLEMLKAKKERELRKGA